MRQAEPVVRGYAVTHPSGTVVLPTGPGWNQLVYASTGVMTVETEEGTWVVPPHRALWAPAGASCRIVMHGRVAVRTLYLSETLPGLPDDFGSFRAVNVPPLLRELVLHAVRASPLDLDRPDHERLIGVILDQLTTLPQAPLQLPMPSDERAAGFATALIADPVCEEGVDALAGAAGTSRRTLERVFLDDTGMTIGRWRQRLRLVHALQLLADGQPVTTVAHAVGYSTPSAFAVMFRQQLGESPSRYFS